jgi:multidrug resistance efflux pump
MPQIGEWGPVGVPSTRSKRRQRWLVLAGALLALVAVCLLGWWAWTLLF